MSEDQDSENHMDELDESASEFSDHENHNSDEANLKRLINIGKDRGYFTYGELNDALSELQTNESKADLMAMFEDLNIRVIEEVEKERSDEISEGNVHDSDESIQIDETIPDGRIIDLLEGESIEEDSHDDVVEYKDEANGDKGVDEEKESGEDTDGRKEIFGFSDSFYETIAEELGETLRGWERIEIGASYNIVASETSKGYRKVYVIEKEESEVPEGKYFQLMSLIIPVRDADTDVSYSLMQQNAYQKSCWFCITDFFGHAYFAIKCILSPPVNLSRMISAIQKIVKEANNNEHLFE